MRHCPSATASRQPSLPLTCDSSASTAYFHGDNKVVRDSNLQVPIVGGSPSVQISTNQTDKAQRPGGVPASLKHGAAGHPVRHLGQAGRNSSGVREEALTTDCTCSWGRTHRQLWAVQLGWGQGTDCVCVRVCTCACAHPQRSRVRPRHPDALSDPHMLLSHTQPRRRPKPSVKIRRGNPPLTRYLSLPPLPGEPT